MNERTRLTRIIVRVIEEFPKVHKFLTGGDSGCHPQHLVDAMVERILGESVAQEGFTLVAGDSNKYSYCRGLTEKQAGELAELLTERYGHASRSWAITDSKNVVRFTNCSSRWPVGQQLKLKESDNV